jgi:hypothetical protein
MGGGLMQLVAYGAQDVYLTGNPQITFFKVVYRRHTNFSVEPIQQVWNGNADFNRTVTCNINRNGDLITNMYSVVELNTVDNGSGNGNGTAWGYVRRLGFALIAETKVEIGGSKIDEQWGDWLNVWYELSHKVGQERGFNVMIGNTSELTSFQTRHNGQILYIPLNFWFNRFTGLALPLIALQYHDVRITIQYIAANQAINWSGASNAVPSVLPSMADCYLLIDYVYLDSEERKRFAQASHEYLMEQLQFTGSESLSSINQKYRLNFNHPSKYLIWVPHLQQYNTQNSFVTYVGAAAAASNWSATLDLFAKHVWLASRDDTVVSYGSDGVTLVADEGALVMDLLERTSGSSASYPGSALAAVAAKVTAQLVLPAGQDVSGTVITTDNVVLLTNSTTVADLSATVDTYAVDTQSSTYFSSNCVTVVDQFNYGMNIDGTQNPVDNAKIQLNGHDRFQQRDGNYFNYVQPWQHFSNTPSDGVNVYSFALKPEEHQPSGTCNFSRIDNATLAVTLNNALRTTLSSSSDSILNIYTVNYNVLRVMSGMAGTAYSN